MGRQPEAASPPYQHVQHALPARVGARALTSRQQPSTRPCLTVGWPARSTTTPRGPALISTPAAILDHPSGSRRGGAQQGLAGPPPCDSKWKSSVADGVGRCSHPPLTPVGGTESSALPRHQGNEQVSSVAASGGEATRCLPSLGKPEQTLHYPVSGVGDCRGRTSRFRWPIRSPPRPRHQLRAIGRNARRAQRTAAARLEANKGVAWC